MKTVVEPLEGNKVKLSVEVDEREFDEALDAAFRRMAREIRVPGFRPGKVPRRLLEARVGAQTARQEALRESLPDYYARALRESAVEPIAPPEIDITAGQDQGPVSFDAVVEVRPHVSIAGYGGLRVTVPSPEVTDEEVDAALLKLRQQFGELRPVTRPARDGDHVSVDLHGERAGEPVAALSADDYLYEVGSGVVAPELDDVLRGSRPGDILRCTAKVDEGDLVSFRVLVKEVKEQVLPEVTDEWAAEASEFETVEELRADIRRRLGAVKRTRSAAALREETLRAVAELVAEDPPEVLVKDEMERRIADMARRLEASGQTVAQHLASLDTSEDELLETVRNIATDAVKVDLALRALTELEGLEPTDDEIERGIAKLAARLGQDPARLRVELERNDAIPTVRSDVRKGKAFEWLVERVEIVDEEGRLVDRTDLAPPPEAAEHESHEGGEPE